MNKKISTGIRSLFIIIIAILLLSILGYGSITKFVFDKFLFTTYNIVGIIMTLVTIFGGYITKKQGHRLYLALTIISGLITVLSYTTIILSLLNINLWDLVLKNVIKPVGTFLLWTIIGVGALALILFIVYLISNLVSYIKDKKKSKIDNNVCQSQPSIVVKTTIEDKETKAELKSQIQSSKKISSTHQNQEKFNTMQGNNSIVVNDKNKIVELAENDLILPNDYELKISKNICPICGWYLKKRINHQTGEQFRGCTNFGYHNCNFTISNEEYRRIQRKYH